MPSLAPVRLTWTRGQQMKWTSTPLSQPLPFELRPFLCDQAKSPRSLTRQRHVAVARLTRCWGGRRVVETSPSRLLSTGPPVRQHGGPRSHDGGWRRPDNRLGTVRTVLSRLCEALQPRRSGSTLPRVCPLACDPGAPRARAPMPCAGAGSNLDHQSFAALRRSRTTTGRHATRHAPRRRRRLPAAPAAAVLSRGPACKLGR